MRADELRVGRLYAFPTNPGPWYRHAVPARVMAHALRERVLVLFPDGRLPRGAWRWVAIGSIAATSRPPARRPTAAGSSS